MEVLRGTPGNPPSTLIQLGDGLSVMRSIIKEMEVAVKKQPNVSRAIKDSIPKLEEYLDNLQYLAKSLSEPQPQDCAGVTGSKEGGKRCATSPPVLEVFKSTKKAKSEDITRRRLGDTGTPLKGVDAASSKMTQTPTSEWSVVARKKSYRSKEKVVPTGTCVSKGNEKEKEQKRKEKRGGNKKKEKPAAILVKPAESKSYAEVLNLVRTKVNPDSCGVQVKSIRRTKAGELLVELQKSSTEQRSAFQSALKNAVGDASEVRELVPKSKVEIRDLDDCTTIKEIEVALQNSLGDYKGTLEINLTKSNERGQRMAIVSMEVNAATILLQKEKIRLGWVNCRIRRRVDVSKCFKCLGYGHLGSSCKGPDRGNLCFQCGVAGHRAKECKSEPTCYLCSDKESNGRKHMAGSGACAVFRKALDNAKRQK